MITLGESADQAVIITLLDVKGNVCLRQQAVSNSSAEVDVPVAGLKPGLYLLRVEINKRFETIKIIKR
jgi:hypothetical protein